MTKNELKYYSSLLTKKYRKEEKKFLVEGFKLVDEALKSNFICEKIFFTNNFKENHLDLVEKFSNHKISFEIISKKEIEKISDVKTSQEIVAVFLEKLKGKTYFNSKIIVALENINDPGNFGTILRNCDWFGITEIIASGDCAEILNPKVIRASAGSVFHLNINEDVNFIDTLLKLKNDGYKLLCSDLNGIEVSKIQMNEKIILAFSNEANGPTETLTKISDEIITIPRKGSAESLNVANASAVILYELTK